MHASLKKRAQAYRYISRIYRSRPRRCLRDQWIGVKPSPWRSGLQKHRARLRDAALRGSCSVFSRISMHSSLLRNRPGTKRGKSSAMGSNTSILI